MRIYNAHIIIGGHTRGARNFVTHTAYIENLYTTFENNTSSKGTFLPFCHKFCHKLIFATKPVVFFKLTKYLDNHRRNKIRQ